MVIKTNTFIYILIMIFRMYSAQKDTNKITN